MIVQEKDILFGLMDVPDTRTSTEENQTADDEKTVFICTIILDDGTI